jgi:hypothetical protein
VYASIGVFDLSAEAGAFVVTGQDAGTITERMVLGEAGAFLVSGQSAGFNNDRYLVGAAASFALSGSAADLVATGQTRKRFVLIF